jgi:hypothetical protein
VRSSYPTSNWRSSSSCASVTTACCTATLAPRPLLRRPDPRLVRGWSVRTGVDAVAEPTAIGRVIAAWLSFALIGAYEMLMRQVRRTVVGSGKLQQTKPRMLVSSVKRSGTAGELAPGNEAAAVLERPGPAV